jgi:uncharacterized repeat protein (TIGR01451 family)
MLTKKCALAILMLGFVMASLLMVPTVQARSHIDGDGGDDYDLGEPWLPGGEMSSYAREDDNAAMVGSGKPELRLEKSGPAYAHEGDTITYTLTVSNTGDVRLTGAAIDPNLPTLKCFFVDLEPGESVSCSDSYTIPLGSEDPLSNVAYAAAVDAQGRVAIESDEHVIDLLHPDLDVATSVSPPVVTLGDSVTWTVTLTNAGDADLTGVQVADSESHDYGPAFDLAAGEQVHFIFDTSPSYSLTRQVDVVAYDVLEQEVRVSAAATVRVLAPSIEVEKLVSTSVVTAGEGVTWTIRVYNRGDVPLYDVVVEDSNGLTFGPVTLAADDGVDGGGPDQISWTYETFPVQDVVNLASVRGVDELGGVVSDEAQASVQVNEPDRDSDGDGLYDAYECPGGRSCPDSDGDGDPDYLDPDDDGDGIPTSLECPDGLPCRDSDDDGTVDYLDLDSDGDGIPDSIEAGSVPEDPLDSDSDGVPDYRDRDSDDDGIPDSIEAGSVPEDPLDSDSDGVPDYRDRDSDDDGIPDNIEAGSVPENPVDSDGDGTPDYRDLDSDDDGIPDAGEWSEDDNDRLAACAADDPVCFNNDADGDGLPNYIDLDSDGDSFLDSEEGLWDSDADGIPEWLDPLSHPESQRFYCFMPILVR